MPKHLDLALRSAEGRGASAQQLANLKRMGEVFIRFTREGSAPAGAAPELPLPDLGPAPTATPAAATAPVGAAAAAPPVSRPFAPGSAPSAIPGGPSAGTCGMCGSGFEVGRGNLHIGAAGGVSGIGAYLVARFFGLIGALALLAGIGSLGMFVALIGTRVRCSGCGVLPDPGEAPPELARRAWTQRIGFLVGAILLAATSVGLAVFWLYFAASYA
jgi:hypothetical protein